MLFCRFPCPVVIPLLFLSSFYMTKNPGYWWRFLALLKVQNVLQCVSRVVDKWLSIGRWGCQIMIRKTWPWTIEGIVIKEYNGPCTLNNSFVYSNKSRRIVATTKRLNFSPYRNLYTFSVGVNSHGPGWPIYFLISMY